MFVWLTASQDQMVLEPASTLTGRRKKPCILSWVVRQFLKDSVRKEKMAGHAGKGVADATVGLNQFLGETSIHFAA